ncbi:hypothetical protein B566_EDAN016094 [Ephemera danica]|nr:hypothetical protein B566_EDAN016094 [Ephemera danica]
MQKLPIFYEPCPVGSKDFRQSQCEAFNGKLFMGRYYMWEPFLDAPNPCVLNCRAVGFRFYATLNQSVVDGTPCHIASAPHHASHPERNKEPWICVAGQCKVGLDHFFLNSVSINIRHTSMNFNSLTKII